MKRQLPFLIVFLASTAAFLAGWLGGFDRILLDTRYELVGRPASGDIVVVEIDAKSIAELAVWPWPRAFHARLIDALDAAGAKQIAFDVDFSARSTPDNDAALSEAAARARGRIVLPAFKQPNRDGGFQYSAPYPDLARHATLGSVNVRLDPDNVVRWYEMRSAWRTDAEIPSLAEVLAASDGDAAAFVVDYGIDAETVPRLSYADVLAGRFDPAAIRGRNVLVGATAIELGDILPTPVLGAMPGPVVQALAFESLHQGRALQPAPPFVPILIAMALAGLFVPWLALRNWRIGLVIAALACVALASVTVFIQAIAPLSFDVALPIAVIALGYLVGVLREFDRQALELIFQRMAGQRRRAMFRSVVDDSFDGIVIANEAGMVELFNASAERILGMDEEDAVGQPIDRIISTDRDREAVSDGDPDASDADGQDGSTTEIDIVHRDGTVVSIELCISVSKLKFGKSILRRDNESQSVTIYTFRDISERKRVQAAEHEAMEQALAANRAKTEFLANMSHELRTPLNAIIGFSEILKGQMFGALGAPQYLDYVGDIHNSGQHLLEVINDILDMSKIEAGQMKLSESTIDISAVVESSIRLVLERAQRARQSLTVSIAKDVPGLCADERMAKQMLLNLLSNAVKFTPEDGAVAVRASLGAGGTVSIAVSDTGIGIAADDIEKALTPFGQADSKLERKYEGTGLGLPLVKSMMHLHGGTIEIESSPGAGTTVTLRFPAERSVAATPAQAALGVRDSAA